MRKAGLWLAAVAVVVFVFGVMVFAGCGSSTTTTTIPVEAPTTVAPAETTTSVAAAEFTLVQPGKLVVGSDTTFPPMESMNGTVAEGFDVDLMGAIAQKLGLQMDFKTEIFDTLIPTLKAGGKFDVIASSMTITDERKKEIDFSDPYIDSNQSIAVMKSANIKDRAGLAGKKIGVQSGTTGEAWAKENLTDSTLVPFDTTTKAFSSLQADNVAAVVNDLPVSAYIVKSDSAQAMAIIEEIPTGEQYGFAVAKTNPGLLAAVNQALTDLKADGTYQQIYDTWFATGQ